MFVMKFKSLMMEEEFFFECKGCFVTVVNVYSKQAKTFLEC